jgi:hypothetical protein
MYAYLRIEDIGRGSRQNVNSFSECLDTLIPGIDDKHGYGSCYVGRIKSRCWVAEIKGLSPRYKYDRKFLKGKVDYSEASSNCNRGVYLEYFLEAGVIYEVSEPVSNKNTRRYFCTADTEGNIIKLDEEEVYKCLQNISSELTYLPQQNKE